MTSSGIRPGPSWTTRRPSASSRVRVAASRMPSIVRGWGVDEDERRGHPRIVAQRRPRVVDVALWYGERSGGIRTYLDAKVAHARATAAFEHHVVLPGPRERHRDGRHELPSLRLVAANGYRVPLGARALRRTLARLRPDVVLLHDPFWLPLHVTEQAHELGARVVAVHHGSAALDAAGMPGPSSLWEPLFCAWLRHAYAPVDAIASVVDTRPDCGRPASFPLRLGVHAAFRPHRGMRRGDHVLYVGRLGREKGVFRLLEAAAASEDAWPLRFVGSGPAEDALRRRARALGVAHRVAFAPYVRDRARLARAYAGARCVVMPGEHETFGLVALEAAASGAPVVACDTAPSAALLGELAHTYAPGDVAGLAAAVAAAREAPPQPGAATELGWRYGWDRLFADELSHLTELLA
jgi:alpha-1,6-mannosyltransferase